ncbi:MAG: PTS sugar transporter subunit IIA [Phycisphaerae bacterium]|nr:PTS sugar transporter subunit IIA [Phycisphaerae bacterium]
MPHEQMNEQQVAAYLSMDLREVVRMASRETIPCRKLGDQKFIFRKSQIDHWVWQQMHNFDHKTLAGIEKGVSDYHGFDASEPLICPLIPDNGIIVPLAAKTRQAVLGDLLDIAEAAGLVYARQEILDELRGRESLCSTALLPGVALPHPRHPLPYDIAASFIVVGLSDRGIPFGAEGGSLTRLFFLLCCKDDRTHLHVLARLVRMIEPAGTIDQLLAAETAEELAEILAHKEMEVLNQQ